MWNLLIGLVVGICIGTLGFYWFFLPVPQPSRESFGQFSGMPNVTLLDDGRVVYLNADFAYIDADQKAWISRAGSKVDGASIPQVFWSLIGGPFEGKYRNASIVHDTACDEMKEPSDQVHRMFYFACRCGGVKESEAKALYYAVARFGPSWKLVHEMKAVENGQVTVVVSKAVDYVPPSNPTKEQAEAIFQYFKAKNPELDTIPQIDIGKP